MRNTRKRISRFIIMRYIQHTLQRRRQDFFTWMLMSPKTVGITIESLPLSARSRESLWRRFPPKAVLLLQEYSYKSQHMKMRETVAVYLADCVVSSIMYLISKERSNEGSAQKTEMDYGKLATAVIRRKIESKILNDSDITLSDLGGIEKIYTGEKLYYDFLRRE